MTKSISLCAACITLFALGARPATAQERPRVESRDDPYFLVKLMLGLGGSVTGSNPTVGGITTGGVSGSANLDPTFGGGLQYMHPLHRYFALGGVFALQSWRSSAGGDNNRDRNTLLDLAIAPQGRLPLSHDVELYLSLPIGATLDFYNEISASVGGVSVSADNAVGWNLALMAGARFALGERIGLAVEAGYARHEFSHDLHGNVPGIASGTLASLDMTLEQFALNAGVFF